jgi:hypothetical protein
MCSCTWSFLYFPSRGEGGRSINLLTLAERLNHLKRITVPLRTTLHNLNSKLHFTFCNVFLRAHWMYFYIIKRDLPSKRGVLPSYILSTMWSRHRQFICLNLSRPLIFIVLVVNPKYVILAVDVFNEAFSCAHYILLLRLIGLVVNNGWGRICDVG